MVFGDEGHPLPTAVAVAVDEPYVPAPPHARIGLYVPALEEHLDLDDPKPIRGDVKYEDQAAEALLNRLLDLPQSQYPAPAELAKMLKCETRDVYHKAYDAWGHRHRRRLKKQLKSTNVSPPLGLQSPTTTA